MRIAITGNLGYIGPVVVEHLARTRPNDELIGIDTGFFAARIADSRALAERFLSEQRYSDIRDITASELKGVDAIIHLAALSNDPLSKRYESLTSEINHAATVALAQAARNAGVKRFVFASSCSVYGAAEQAWINEDSPVAPLTPYAASKLATERSLAELAGDQFVVTCLRFATAYGWSPRLRLDLVLNDFVASAVATGEIVLASSGEAWRPLIHVRDMARAMEWGLVRETSNSAFLSINAGSTASNWRVLDLATTVSQTLGDTKVCKPDQAPVDLRSYRVNFDRFERLAPGFAPVENLSNAAREIVDGLRRIDYSGSHRSRYLRLETLTGLQDQNLLDSTLRWRKPHGACRLCQGPLEVLMADLGQTPLANEYPEPALSGTESKFPLEAWVCSRCWLVQLGHMVPAEQIFSDYAYLSSYSTSWVEHARLFTERASKRLGLDGQSRVLEIASNDGYLLQHFLRQGVPCLGIEPAANVAAVARENGIETINKFFNRDTALELKASGWRADLTVANNVLAHVPDLHGFVEGFAIVLKPDGVAAFEFPHLLELMQQNQFDTIYHEHYSYFSLIAVQRLFSVHGLRVFDVERLATHGGSLRLWVCHQESTRFATLPSVEALLDEERRCGLDTPAPYLAFSSKAQTCRQSLRALLERLHLEGKSVAAYGAAAKGNTLLNYCGISRDRVSFVADRNPLKQGKCLPGSGIPIFDPAAITERKPDYLLILPWNLTDEIRTQMASIRDWGGRFIRPVPEVEELA